MDELAIEEPTEPSVPEPTAAMKKIEEERPLKGEAGYEESPGADEAVQWAEYGNGIYAPSPKVTSKVPAGVYKLSWSQSLGTHLVKQKTVLSDELLDLPIKEIREIVSDIEQFWDPVTKAKFRKYDMTYKRGIIVWGPPGNGKSMMMQLVIKNLIRRDGVILTLDTVEAVQYFIGFANTFRRVEPERPLVVVLEDIDNVIEAGSSVLSALMNILDGVNQIDNVVYMATTNYPEISQMKRTRTSRQMDAGFKTANGRVK